MQAIILQNYGSPEVLELTEIDIGSPGPTEVQVAVQSSSVNPIDWKIRSGKLKVASGWRFPKQLGADISGIVRSVGSQVTKYKPGDEVFGMLPAVKGGAYAEYCNVEQEYIFFKPSTLNFNEAAALPLAGMTALQGLRSIARIKPNDKVLINGCTGGVGSLAVQIAKFLGANVTGSCGPRNRELAKDLGVDVVLDYNEESIPPDGKEFNIIFDAAANLSYWVCTHNMPKKSFYLRTLPDWELFTIAPLLSPLTAKVGKFFFVKPNASDLELLSEMVERNSLFPHIEHVYNLPDIADAHQLSETGHVRGKIVININTPMEIDQKLE